MVGKASSVSSPWHACLSPGRHGFRERAGDILTVERQVTLPQGTEVFLRTYREDQYDVRADTQEDGGFVLSAGIRDHDDQFVLLTCGRRRPRTAAEAAGLVTWNTCGGCTVRSVRAYLNSSSGNAPASAP